MATKDWFTSWFDTPYYHILYKHRNDEEAQHFMQHITSFLQLPKTAHILDLPCGKGRHSIYLNSLGYTVSGRDLSGNSIKHAQQFENNALFFKQWDMRNPLDKKFDAIFNLFTSFGYFDDDNEDIKILQNIKNGLQENGVFVMDFLNVIKTKQNLVAEEVKTIDNITFHIQRQIKDGFIQKHIAFTADEQEFNFTEKVKFLDLDKMKTYFNEVGFTINHIFGDYDLNAFDAENSNRLIIVAQ